MKWKILEDIVGLTYPQICLHCGDDALNKEAFLCYSCFKDLPYTNFEGVAENRVAQIFAGRVKYEKAFATFYFKHGSVMQSLLHQLKYKGNKQLGLQLGKMMGFQMQTKLPHNDFDCLVPLPLHPKKELKRGFNQSKLLSEGISAVLNKPIVFDSLIRQEETETQTKKSREERWENVVNSFALKNPENLDSKHVLLVDDVLTTGATIEAAASVLVKKANVRISIATLTYATK